ncbi:hypothetical protein MMC18_009236 [Xylographa bjoerkii]|nr:hypothetical protein [Xylographa bjoerkii]
MARAITNAEWQWVKDQVLLTQNPLNLTQAQCTWTGPPTVLYNCIGWAIADGIGYLGWINPPNDQQTFTVLYGLCGYFPCTYAQSTHDGYAKNGVMTHGSRLNSAAASMESKMGSGFRMLHPRDGLAGAATLYGQIVLYFRRPPAPVAAPPATTVTAAQPTPGPVHPSTTATPSTAPPSGETSTPGPVLETKMTEKERDQVQTLSKSLAKSYSALADTFETRYVKWKGTWGSHGGEQSSSVVAKGPEWDELVAMGSNILPDVINKLTLSGEVFATELYNKLQVITTKKVDPKDVLNYYVLTNQAAWIVKHYASVITAFESNTDKWQAHQETKMASSNSNDYLSHESYAALVHMGNEIVPLVMDKYAHDQHGWWHQLLHEIVNGKASGASTFNAPELYKHWTQWFEGGLGDRQAATAAA